MASKGKRYAEARQQIDRTREYTMEEAVAILKSLPTAKFDETVEVHMNLNVDVRQADQQVRSTVMLPAGTGQQVRVLALVEGEAVQAATEAGADYVGTDEYVDRIQEGWLEFDVAVAIPQVMGKIGRLGRILGPRGLMPNPRAGTVVQAEDIGAAIEELKQGRVEFRTDRTANLHIPIGKLSFSEDDLMRNLTTVMNAVIAARPAAARGRYIRRAVLTSTMGPGIVLDTAGLGAKRAAA